MKRARGQTPSRVLLMPDKFKGTLTAEQVARAMARGVRDAWPRAQLTVRPLSDGGDGFVRLMVQATSGRLRSTRVPDAAGRVVRAPWGILGGVGGTAVVDTASTCGLATLPPELRRPGQTSSFGTGLVMRRAVENGCRTIIVGLGGSATNDGGMGLAAAWGYRFFAGSHELSDFAGASLGLVTRIQPPDLVPRVRIIAATDVRNPLCGPDGATHQFAPQKGAGRREVLRLEAGMRSFAKVVQACLGRDVSQTPGAGAAGGIGFGLFAFLGAESRGGFELFSEYAGLARLIQNHDLVVTGEGCFDRTSLAGKGPLAVANLARQHGRPTWAVCGRVRLRPRPRVFERLRVLQTSTDPQPPPTDRSLNLQRVRSATRALFARDGS